MDSSTAAEPSHKTKDTPFLVLLKARPLALRLQGIGGEVKN